MECHSIQFTTISINVERGIVKILFKYRYFQDLLIDIDIDIDISQILLIDIDIDIDIFQNHHIDIDIDIVIFGIALSISISISIFSKMTISISIFSTSPNRYRYRYQYFSKVSIYRQSICHIDISNRATSAPEWNNCNVSAPIQVSLSHDHREPDLRPAGDPQ